MEVKSIPSSQLQIACLSLADHVPGLSARSLLAALRRYCPGDGPKIPPGTMLTIAEAAQRLKCHRSTVWRMIARGVLPKVLLGPRSARIPESAVAAFAEGGRVS